VDWQAPQGKGHCDVLNLDTLPEFGCLSFLQLFSSHEEICSRLGEAWQYYWDVPCPDCNGQAYKCQRCMGTGRVRKYGDGYVGEERTRMHPKEKELKSLGKEIPVLPGTTLTPEIRADRPHEFMGGGDGVL
jgi:hypothetical protein